MAGGYGARGVMLLGAAIAGGVALPVACFFPDYTFDLHAGGGGTGGKTGSSSTSISSGGTTSSSTSTASGGTGGVTGSTTSSTSTTSTSSSSTTSTVPPCASADCSDPACVGSYACFDDVPTGSLAGWTGYFALYDGPAASDPGCNGKYPTSKFAGNAGLNAPPATCSCTCGTPQGATCTITGTLDSRDALCGGSFQCGADLPTDWSVPCQPSQSSPRLTGGQDCCGPNTTTCNSPDGGACGLDPCNLSLRLGPTSVTGGSCTPNAPAPTIPPVTWGKVGEACGDIVVGTGCNTDGKVCLPTPQAPYRPGLCIMQAGDHMCPPGKFSDHYVYYTGVQPQDDTRGCTTCTCGAASGSTCSATVTVYSTDTCTGTPIATLDVNSTTGACADLNPPNAQVSARKAVMTTPSGGSCAPTGGQATGAATPSGATTFCCIP